MNPEEGKVVPGACGQAVPFDLGRVEEGIAGVRFAGTIRHLETVESTNALALESARLGVGCGVWVADEQTAGRGRGDHRWHSAPGEGIYLSVLVTPRLALARSLQLSLRTAIAVQAAIASVHGFRVPDEIDIRWPNDLLLRGRKCGGILIETAGEPAPASGTAMMRYAVIGVGINLNHSSFPAELELMATSLRRELGNLAEPLPREPLIAAILMALDEQLRVMVESPNAPLDLGGRSSYIIGKRVQVPEQGGYMGTTAGLNADGFLLVDADDGTRRTVLSGGVRALS